MELGERLRQARLAAGMSQREVCGTRITRNMLSQIEHGTAKPSMETLRYLAQRLGKPVSAFLDEDALLSPNQAVVTAAREAFDAGDDPACLAALSGYRVPDAVFDREYRLLLRLCNLRLGAQALAQGRLPYAAELLTRAGEGECPYFPAACERQRLLLLACAQRGAREEILARLSPDDTELLLRAAAALERGDAASAARYLDAAEERDNPRWSYLRGEVYLHAGDFAAAAACYHRAEAEMSDAVAPKLEACYRELGDFKLAYAYAVRQLARK